MKEDWTGIITKVRERSTFRTELLMMGQICSVLCRVSAMLSKADGCPYHPYGPKGSRGWDSVPER